MSKSKRSVLSIDEFIGWPKMIQLCEAGGNDRDKALPAILFQTGSRISEVLQLNSKHFRVEDGWVVCQDLPLVKQKKIRPFRSFSFPITEPLWPYSEKWIRLKEKKDLLFPYNRDWAYKKVVAMGKKVDIGVWPQWFRSQRASQVSLEYGLEGVSLEEWFKVRDPSWGRRYSKKGVTGLQNIIARNIQRV